MADELTAANIRQIADALKPHFDLVYAQIDAVQQTLSTQIESNRVQGMERSSELIEKLESHQMNCDVKTKALDESKLNKPTKNLAIGGLGAMVSGYAMAFKEVRDTVMKLFS